jgi:hypothetical protein
MCGLVGGRNFPFAKKVNTSPVTLKGLHSSLKVPPGATVDYSVLEMATDRLPPLKVEPLTVVSAHYGVADKWIDVTEIVKNRISNWKLDVLVGNEPFDPLDEIAPNRGKYLKIEYQINSGFPKHVEWQEGQRAVLPLGLDTSTGHVKSLSDVSRKFEFAENSTSKIPEIPVDLNSLQPFHFPAPVIATSESGDLLITIDKEEWHPFDHRALILGVRITVVNKSDQEHALTGVGVRGIDPWSLSMHDIDVGRETYRYKESRPQFHGTSPPGETTIGWVWMAFDQRFGEGRPGYRLTIEDGVGNKYEFPIAARSPQSFEAR